MITMINNWLVWSLGLFDDWFMKVQSISPEFDCTSENVPLILYYFNLHTVKNTLNSYRDNYFPNDNYD